MMKYSIFGLLLCLISLFSLADSMCGPDAWFVAETSECHHPTLGRWHAGSPRPNQQYQPRDYYGAIAANTATGKGSGHADNFQSLHAAEAGALETCGHPGCQVIVSYKNSCGSMVAATTPIGSPNHIAGGVGNTPDEAEQNAFAECERLNPGWQCLLWAKGKCSYRE